MGRAAGVALAILLGVGAPIASGEVMVRVSGAQVDVQATAAPLADVLDRLGHQTGMKIVYEGPPPRQLVTVTLQGRSPTEAVLGLLEGQGLNFALVSDPTGTRVETLILAGAAGTGTSAGRSASAAPTRAVRRPFAPPPGASPDLTDPTFDQLQDEPFEDPSALPDELAEDAPEDVPSGQPGQAPTAPATVGPPPVTSPFPGGRPQTFPASPFTPQPYPQQPFPPAPPGTPGATDVEETAPADDVQPPR